MNDYMYDDELMHYGVLGMKWGVRRSRAQLEKARTSGNKEQRNHAVATLSSHRDKINKKLSSLESKGERLEKKRYKSVVKSEPKIAKYNKKAAKLRQKASTSFFPINERGLTVKANKLDVKVSKLEQKTAKIKAKIEKNERLKKSFETGLKDIDRTLTVNGENFIKKYS